MASLPGLWERTMTVSGASKTFRITGWRIGSVVAPRDITVAIRKVHDFLTVGAPAPLQEGVASALKRLPADYYQQLSVAYRKRRDILYDGLCEVGFRRAMPHGAYYILAEFSELSELEDEQSACWLPKEVGVAAVPGSSFFRDPEEGRRLLRFAFCRTSEVLEAVRRLQLGFPNAHG